MVCIYLCACFPLFSWKRSFMGLGAGICVCCPADTPMSRTGPGPEQAVSEYWLKHMQQTSHGPIYLRWLIVSPLPTTPHSLPPAVACCTCVSSAQALPAMRPCQGQQTVPERWIVSGCTREVVIPHLASRCGGACYPVSYTWG